MRRPGLIPGFVLAVGMTLAPATHSLTRPSPDPAALPSVGSPSAATSTAARRRPAPVRVKGSFTIATFNVLGNDHTEGRRKRRGFARGPERMRLTVKALLTRDIDVVALQELEEEQWRAFGKLAGTRYRLWADERHSANAVAWRAKKFAFVRGRTIGVPYFHGKIKQMPVVLLRHRSTGQTMAFTSFHNPVTSKRRPGNDKWRRLATTREITLANNLAKRRVPAFLSGDFNERSRRWHCRVARATNMVTAGNGDRRGGSCRPLDRMRIDWIFGSDGVIFSDYMAVESRRIRRASDHPLIVVRVR